MLSRYSTLSYHGPNGWERQDNFVYFDVKLNLFFLIITTKSMCIILHQNLYNI